MVDLIALGVGIINNLYTNTENKTAKSIDAIIDTINHTDEHLPVLFRDKSVLTHSLSKRYGNGVLVNEFIDVTSLEPEQEQQLLRLKALKDSQQYLFNNAITAVIECALGIMQAAPENHTRQQAFILLFDEELWLDKQFIKMVSDYLNDEEITQWYESYLNLFKQPPIDIQVILDKIDGNGNSRKIIREFTDIYYGLDFLDNF